jgi:hypothetical protein
MKYAWVLQNKKTGGFLDEDEFCYVSNINNAHLYKTKQEIKNLKASDGYYEGENEIARKVSITIGLF